MDASASGLFTVAHRKSEEGLHRISGWPSLTDLIVHSGITVVTSKYNFPEFLCFRNFEML